MFETVVIATDGSESAARAVEVGVDVADRFDATVHALYVVDERELAGAPEKIRDDYERALEAVSEDAFEPVESIAEGDVVTAVRKGEPTAEICRYADEHEADAVAIGTRGRHGDHAYILGSVAEAVVRHCSCPVLSVRQLESTDDTDEQELLV